MPEEETEYVNPWGPGGESYPDWETNQWATNAAATTEPEELAGGTPEKIELDKPLLIPQHGVTCWAATLASWRRAVGRKGGTFKEVMDHYKAKGYVGPNGEMEHANGVKMLKEEGMKSSSMAGAKVTYQRLKDLLAVPGRHNYIYLVYQPMGAAFSHAILVYGVERTASDEFVRAMNPQKTELPDLIFFSDFANRAVLVACVQGL